MYDKNLTGRNQERGANQITLENGGLTGYIV